MTFLFRHHRGSLADSMDTVIEVESIEQLCSIIESVHGSGKISARYYCFDQRINWQTYIVCHDNGYDRGPVGFANANPFGEQHQ